MPYGEATVNIQKTRKELGFDPDKLPDGSHVKVFNHCSLCKSDFLREYKQRNLKHRCDSKVNINGIRKKWCPHCGDYIDTSMFSKKKNTHDGLSSMCKSYQALRGKPNRSSYYHRNKEVQADRMRWNTLRRKYGITKEEYLDRLEDQEGRCKACGTTDPGTKYGNFLVDHNHSDGAIRGLLCLGCNSAIGFAKDNPSTLVNLSRYVASNGNINSDPDEHVNHPIHYRKGKIEVIEMIRDNKMSFCLGNALKYISRAGHKDPDKFKEDLRKSIWYLEYELTNGSNPTHRITHKYDIDDYCSQILDTNLSKAARYITLASRDSEYTLSIRKAIDSINIVINS